MLYYFFDYLQNLYDFPGAGLFQYISFRAAMAVITSVLADQRANIIDVAIKKQEKSFVSIVFELGVKNRKHLAYVIRHLRRETIVIQVNRLSQKVGV